MYRLLERFRPARKKQQTLGKSSHQRVADRSREPVEGAVEITTAHNCWEASDQRRDTNAAHLSGVRVFGLAEGIVNAGDVTGNVVTVVPPPETGSPLALFCRRLYYQTCLSGG